MPIILFILRLHSQTTSLLGQWTVRGSQLICTNQLIAFGPQRAAETYMVQAKHSHIYNRMAEHWKWKTNADTIYQRVNLLSCCLEALWILFSLCTHAKSADSNSLEFLHLRQHASYASLSIKEYTIYAFITGSHPLNSIYLVFQKGMVSGHNLVFFICYHFVYIRYWMQWQGVKEKK